VPDPEAIYFENCVLKITSKSPSRHLVRLQGKLKLTEKEKQCVYVNFHYIFSKLQCTSRQPISVVDLT